MRNHRRQVMQREYLATLKSGIEVYDRADSILSFEIQNLLCEILPKFSYVKRVVAKQYGFDRVIGKSVCIPTNEDDVQSGRIFFLRDDRDRTMRMVKEKPALDTKFLSFVLMKTNEGEDQFYTVRTAYIGELAVKNPNDSSIRNEDEKQKSEQFWSTHALVCEDGVDENIVGNELNNNSGLIDISSDQEKVHRDLGKMNRGKLSSVWDKIQLLWTMVKDPEAPTGGKITALAALVYVINPIDLIPDMIPVLGLTDDVSAVIIAVSTLADMLVKYQKGLESRLSDLD